MPYINISTPPRLWPIHDSVRWPLVHSTQSRIAGMSRSR